MSLVARAKAALEALRRRHAELAAAYKSLLSEVNKLEADLRQIREMVERLKKELPEAQTYLQEAQRLAADIRELSRQIEALRQRKASFLQQLRQLSTIKSQLETKAREVEQLLTKVSQAVEAGGGGAPPRGSAVPGQATAGEEKYAMT